MMRIKNIGMLLMGSFLVLTSIFFIYQNNVTIFNMATLVIGGILIIYYLSKSLNKEFVPLEEILNKEKQQNRITTIFDRLTFFDMFMIWVLIISLFGLSYYFFSREDSFLFYTRNNQPVTNILDALYFSFITATSTGFGDITPHGNFKILTIVEVIFGLSLLATLTSKLVSIKEDAILNEIYEISFNERLSRLRSSFLVFRQNMGRIITKVEEGSVSKREINDLYTYISTLETTLNEVSLFFGKTSKNIFAKSVDPLNTELIFNSIIHSFNKLEELINVLKYFKVEWKRDVTIEMINKCINVNEKLFEQLNASKILPEKNIIGLNSQKRRVVNSIKDGLV